jgi:hypothetical protein
MLLFSLFSITCLVNKEFFVLLKCYIFMNMTFWPHNVVLSRFSNKMAYVNVKFHFVYKIKIYKYERRFVVFRNMLTTS